MVVVYRTSHACILVLRRTNLSCYVRNCSDLGVLAMTRECCPEACLLIVNQTRHVFVVLHVSVYESLPIISRTT